MKLNEQDIINAICLTVSSKKQINPEQVSVELMWDEEYGFSAEVYDAQQRKQIFVESNLIESIRFYLDAQLKIDPFSAGVQLELDDNEGIVALIKL
jgi:hypothetical protein